MASAEPNLAPLDSEAVKLFRPLVMRVQRATAPRVLIERRYTEPVCVPVSGAPTARGKVPVALLLLLILGSLSPARALPNPAPSKRLTPPLPSWTVAK